MAARVNENTSLVPRTEPSRVSTFSGLCSSFCHCLGCCSNEASAEENRRWVEARIHELVTNAMPTTDSGETFDKMKASMAGRIVDRIEADKYLRSNSNVRLLVLWSAIGGTVGILAAQCFSGFGPCTMQERITNYVCGAIPLVSTLLIWAPCRPAAVHVDVTREMADSGIQMSEKKRKKIICEERTALIAASVFLILGCVSVIVPTATWDRSCEKIGLVLLVPYIACSLIAITMLNRGFCNRKPQQQTNTAQAV